MIEKFQVPSEIKGLIFDLDGTLVDSMPLHMQAWKDACKSYGMSMSSEFLRSFTGSPGTKIAAAIIKKHGLDNKLRPEDVSGLKHSNFDSLQGELQVVKPVADIVKEHYGSLAMAIGTGGLRETVKHSLEICGMKKYFDYIVTADDVEKHKPHPETFLKCAGLMRVDPAHILVFEDGDLGIEAAERAGMTAVDVRSWYDYNW